MSVKKFIQIIILFSLYTTSFAYGQNKKPDKTETTDHIFESKYLEILKKAAKQDYFSVKFKQEIYSALREKISPSDVSGELIEKTPEEIENEMEKLEITAGAKIRQRIYVDPEDLDFWQEEPAGFIYINYVDLPTAEKIFSVGRKEMAGSFLAGVNV